MPDVPTSVNTIREVRQALEILKQHGFLVFDNTPDSFSGKSEFLLRCNAGETALEFTSSAGGGKGDAFVTVDCPSGTDPVAVGTDTLVLATDNNLLTITGNSANDTVTLAVVEGNIDHGSIGGLSDDDHTQYHNDTRGDARYYTETELDAGQLDTRYFTEDEHIDTSAGAADSGKPIKLSSPGRVSQTMRHLWGVQTKTANYAMSLNDEVILADATSGAMTVTLPPVAAASGLVYQVKRINTNDNDVTIVGTVN